MDVEFSMLGPQCSHSFDTAAPGLTHCLFCSSHCTPPSDLAPLPSPCSSSSSTPSSPLLLLLPDNVSKFSVGKNLPFKCLLCLPVSDLDFTNFFKYGIMRPLCSHRFWHCGTKLSHTFSFSLLCLFLTCFSLFHLPHSRYYSH